MKTPVFTGASVAIVTPFNDDYTVNFDALGELIEFQIANGTSAITICGTTGEAAALDDSEHKKCIKYCVDKVAGRIPVIAGTGSNDTAYALQLSRYAESVGADALLHVTPYYNKTTQTGLVKHFTYIADRVNIPMILYNVPSRTGMCFAADTYKTLSEHPNINGVKEASGNFTLIAQTISLCGDDLNIWSGNDDQTIPIMALGGKGIISVASNIAPRLVADMCDKFFTGDIKGAAEMQTKYFDLFNDLFLEVNPIPVKTAMGMKKMISPLMRMPLCEMGKANAARLEKTLKRFNLL
jgi:4-hydroxy-tetrahydrodipicolinate synthase